MVYDKSLEVLKEVPTDGLLISGQGFMIDWKKYREHPEYKDNTYYYCQYCDGYIPGTPYAKAINTLGPLAGRRGTSYVCLRCRRETSFIGFHS